MATQRNNGRYTLGTLVARLDAQGESLARIEHKLDAIAEWQRETDGLSASRGVRLDNLEATAAETKRKLEVRDNMQVVFSAIAAIAAGITASLVGNK